MNLIMKQIQKQATFIRNPLERDETGFSTIFRLNGKEVFTLIICSILYRVWLSSSSKKIILLNINFKDFIIHYFLLHHLPSYNSLSSIYHLSKMDDNLTNHIVMSPKSHQCPEIDEMTGKPCTVTSDRRFNIDRHRNTMHKKNKSLTNDFHGQFVSQCSAYLSDIFEAAKPWPGSSCSNGKLMESLSEAQQW